MKLVFTRAEVERIILAFANDFTKSPEPFTQVGAPYSYLPSVVEVSTEEKTTEEQE